MNRHVDPIAVFGRRNSLTIVFKLYVSLGDFLPANAVEDVSPIDVDEGASLKSIIDQYRKPGEPVHLFLVNGLFVCDVDQDEPGASSLAVGDEVFYSVRVLENEDGYAEYHTERSDLVAKGPALFRLQKPRPCQSQRALLGFVWLSVDEYKAVIVYLFWVAPVM